MVGAEDVWGCSAMRISIGWDNTASPIQEGATTRMLVTGWLVDGRPLMTVLDRSRQFVNRAAVRAFGLSRFFNRNIDAWMCVPELHRRHRAMQRHVLGGDLNARVFKLSAKLGAGLGAHGAFPLLLYWREPCVILGITAIDDIEECRLYFFGDRPA